MKPWISLVARLYPADWRERYGREFEVLVEDAEPRWLDVWDVLRGALEMQMATWSIGKTAAAVGLAGALIAAGWTLQLPHQYRATGTVQGPADLGPRIQGLEREVLSRSFLVAVIQRENLYRAERRQLPLEAIADRMRRENVQIVPGGNGLLRVTFVDTDSARAQRIAHWIESQMIYVEPSLRVASEPGLPNRPESPARWPAIRYGLAAGVLAGALFAWVRRLPLRRTLRLAAFAVAGALLGFGMYYGWYFGIGPGALLADSFTTHAVLRTQDGQALAARLGSPEVLQAAIREARLYRRRHGGPEDMRRDLRIVRLPSLSLDLVAVSFTYSDRYKAQSALRSVVDSTRAEVVDPPSLPELGIFRDWHFLSAGVLLGIVAGLVRRRPRPTLRPSHA